MISLDPVSNWLRTARWTITAIVLALLVGYIGFQKLEIARIEIDLAHARNEITLKDNQIKTMVAAHALQREADQKQARDTERELVDSANDIRKKADATEQSLRARADDLARKLQPRASRPSGSANSGAVAPAAGAAAGGTGAGLYREDGLFLAGEAASAARIAGERDECRRLYDEAREKLKNGQGGQK
jgi:hypothetical protein